MNLIICKDTFEIVQKSTEWCEEKLKAHSSIFIPTGSTPIPIYEYWEKTQFPALKNKKILQLDEIITGKSKGSFWTFLTKHLPSFLPQIVPVQESSAPAEIAILGLGLNGHVAFHEPGQKSDFFKGVVNLTKETVSNLQLEDGAQGMTYGLEAFRNARAILMVVRGSSKKEIFSRFTKGDSSLPAVQLKSHPDFTVLVEKSVLD